jgi:hypothetical protein
MAIDVMRFGAELDQVWADMREDRLDFMRLTRGAFHGSAEQRSRVARVAGMVSLELYWRFRRFSTGARDEKWSHVPAEDGGTGTDSACWIAQLNGAWADAARRWPDVDRLAEDGFDGSAADRALAKHLATLVVWEVLFRVGEPEWCQEGEVF